MSEFLLTHDGFYLFITAKNSIPFMEHLKNQGVTFIASYKFKTNNPITIQLTYRFQTTLLNCLSYSIYEDTLIGLGTDRLLSDIGPSTKINYKADRSSSLTAKLKNQLIGTGPAKLLQSATQ